MRDKDSSRVALWVIPRWPAGGFVAPVDHRLSGMGSDSFACEGLKERSQEESSPSGGRSIVTSNGSRAGEGIMPLSEDDQRRLDEIERGLQRDDPKFAALQSLDRRRRRRMIAAGVVVLIGVVLLVVGLVLTNAAPVVGVLISVAGFLFMVGGAAVLIRRRRV